MNDQSIQFPFLIKISRGVTPMNAHVLNSTTRRRSDPHLVLDYAEAVRRVESKIATEVNFDPCSHTMLLTHGAKTANAIILVHGYPSSPAPFKQIAAQFYDRGYNVLAMPLPYHGLADRM